MVPHYPQKVNGVGMLYGAGSTSNEFPLTLCSSCPMYKSSDQSCGRNSFYCFGQAKGFLPVNIPKNLFVAAKPSDLSGICELMKRAALALELDFKNTESGEECCKCNVTQTSPNENFHKE